MDGESSEKSGALDGVRVLSMAELYPGPYCTMLLADMGAEVVQIERPGVGDRTRNSWHGRSLGRNKKSFTLNLKAEGGHEVCYRLARTADVFIEGYRPGVARDLGVDYEAIRAQKEDIVYCSISGYGQEGPYRRKPGHDLSYQGLSGVLANLVPSGDFGHLAGVALGDLSSGMFAALAIVSALYARPRNGGQYIDVSMTDGLVSWMTTALTAALNGSAPRREGQGGARPGYGVYQCKDGYFTLSIAGEPYFWQNLAGVTGIDPADIARPEQAQQVRDRIGDFCAHKTRAELDELMEGANVPGGPVLELHEVLHDPHLASRELVQAVSEAGGEVRYLKSPLRFSETPVSIRLPMPALGAHTREMLLSLGYAADEIVELAARGVT